MTIDPNNISEDEVDAIWVALHGAREAGGLGATVLGLDLGRTFAWAEVTGGEVLSCGWYDTVRKNEGGGMSDLRFKRAINDALDSIQPTLLWFEEPIARGGKGREVIAGQAAILRVIALEREVAYGSVNVSTLKKFATGRGNAGKDMMRDSLAERLSM